MKSFSLAQQIEKVDRELELRRRVYPGQVRSGAMRQSVADYHMARMQAALTSLQWLQANEIDVRAFVVAKRTKASPDLAEEIANDADATIAKVKP
jgi:hypothetical protein